MFEELKGKRILITGHTGFKGSWLSLWLNEIGAVLAGYSLNPKTKRDHFVLAGLESTMIDIRGDIRDYQQLLSCFKSFEPEIVFHFAAQPLVRKGYQDPIETFETNIMGTINVLECCRQINSVRQILVISSDKCYENHEWIYGYREVDQIGGFDPYSASKGAVEIIVNSYRNSFFHPTKFESHKISLSSIRAGNIIGGGDWSIDRIVPDCINSLENGMPINVRNPFSIRPWQFILEPLRGYLMLLSNMIIAPTSFCGPWNFGPSYSSIRTVKELVEEIISFYGSGEWINSYTDTSPHEAKLLTLDISKAVMLLKWEPKLTFAESVKFTVDWYKMCSSANIYKIGQEQINNYLSKVNSNNL